MPPRMPPMIPLSELAHGSEGIFFALLTSKEELVTRDKKPYFRVGFRDAGREVNFPIWGDTPWAVACRDEWTPGQFFKIQAVYRLTQYGDQLELRKIREATDDDRADGFDPAMCLPRTRFAPETLFDELLEIANERITQPALRSLVETIFQTNREALLTAPAARHHHHAYLGGLLEHTLCVTRNALFLVERYAEHYADLDPPLDVGLVTAGAILHDIGKLIELAETPLGIEYTPDGELIGHILLGRDMVRDAASSVELDRETQLRLEHIIVSHQRLPEWGSPKPPMTPEALLIHYADDVDAKFHIMYRILSEDKGDGQLTSAKNVLRQRVFRHLE